jgi:hypothetical protein
LCGYFEYYAKQTEFLADKKVATDVGETILTLKHQLGFASG